MTRRLLGATLAVLCLAPPLWADETRKPAAKTYDVPYRMTSFNHVMVRAKINGKGPFNFILDTGAPALFVSTAAAKKAGARPGRDNWGTLDRVEIEGGVVLEKTKARIEDPFQLEGMNGLGLAGIELHGMIGYTVLARYKIELDFTRSKMTWTALDFDPPPPEGLGGKAGSDELNAMGAIMKLLGGLLGKRPDPEVRQRPFLGAELADDPKGVLVISVLGQGPAAAGGVQAGDRISEFRGRTVREIDDVNRYLSKLHPGDKAELIVVRNGQERTLTVKVGEGF
jgi:hypothetical protein